MRAYLALLALLVAGGKTSAADLNSNTHALQFTSSGMVVPVMANVLGLTGSPFKTRVAVLNPTTFSYPIAVTLYDQNGFVKTMNISMAAGQMRMYSNFLEDVFTYVGAGTVRFESAAIPGGDRKFQFAVNSEVYVETTDARYGTSVPSVVIGPNLDSFSAGIRVDANTRTNIGVFNDSTMSNVIEASVFDSSNTFVTSITLTVPAKSWKQQIIPANVAAGYVRFKPAQPAYCYAVVVDNRTNDGHFIPAAEFVP